MRDMIRRRSACIALPTISQKIKKNFFLKKKVGGIIKLKKNQFYNSNIMDWYRPERNGVKLIAKLCGFNNLLAFGSHS